MQNSNIIEIVKSKEAKRKYLFMAEGKPVADLIYPKRFKKIATGSVGNNHWQISRKGFWKHFYNISSDQSPYTEWSISQNWKGSISVRTDDNKLYTLCRKGWLKVNWIWKNENNEPVVEIHHCALPRKKYGTITYQSRPDNKMLWLGMVGWFVVLAAHQDASAPGFMGAPVLFAGG